MAKLQAVFESVNRGYCLTGVIQTDEVLGSGAFGTVYLGYWYGTKVAVKRLHPTRLRDVGGGPSPDVERFIREINLHRTLGHPHVAQVLGVVTSTHAWQSPGIVFEHLDTNLYKRYQATPHLDEDAEVSIAHGVASGLSYLHSVSILHRDLTTRNVMLALHGNGKYRAKITDMGVSRAVAIGSVVHQLSSNPGTLTYMAPEAQVSDDPDREGFYGPPADCFSYALAMLAMVLQREPPSPVSVERHGRHDLDDLSADHPLCDVIRGCILEKDDERLSAQMVCDRLQPLAQPTEAAATPTGSPAPSRSTQSPAPSRSASVSPKKLPQSQIGGIGVPGAAAAAAGYSRSICLEEMPTLHVKQVFSDTGAFPYRPFCLSDQRQSLPTSSPGQSPAPIPRRGSVLDQAALVAEQFLPAASCHGSDEGLRARCLRMLQPDLHGLLQVTAPKWRRVAKVPDHARKCCRRPCVHQDYLYCAFRDFGESEAAVLRRTPMRNLRHGWEDVDMPTGNWHIDLYLASTGKDLICVCMDLEPSNHLYKVVARSPAGEWGEICQLPAAIYRFGVALHGTELIIVGGRIGPQKMDVRVDTAYSLDLEGVNDPGWQSWESNKLLHPCASQSVVVHNDTLHIFGRCDIMREDATSIMSANLRAPLAERRWTMKALKQMPSINCGVAVVNDQLVVCGGEKEPFIVQGFGGTERRASAHVYVRECEKWLPIPALNTAQSFPSVVTDGRRLVCFGGSTETNVIAPWMEVLETDSADPWR